MSLVIATVVSTKLKDVEESCKYFRRVFEVLEGFMYRRMYADLGHESWALGVLSAIGAR